MIEKVNHVSNMKSRINVLVLHSDLKTEDMFLKIHSQNLPSGFVDGGSGLISFGKESTCPVCLILEFLRGGTGGGCSFISILQIK